MALPILENIAVEIVSRLEAITTGNGYELTVEGVHRPRRINRDFSPKHLSIVVEQTQREPKQELSYPGTPPAAAFEATFEIYGFVKESDDSTTSPAVTENQLAACIEKAIAVDADWHTFGDNAINAEFREIEMFEGSAALPFTDVQSNGVKTTLVVLYRVSELDPYALRT